MKVIIFSAQEYEKSFFEKANASFGCELVYVSEILSLENVGLVKGALAVCCFVLDKLDSSVLEHLAKNGIKLIALRSAGFDHVDLNAADRLGLVVTNVPTYSPSAVAEHAVLLVLTLARKFIPSQKQFEKNNFSLAKLLGKGIKGLTVGVVGTGNIGLSFARIMKGFGCELVGYDPYPNDESKSLGLNYVEFDQLLGMSDIISLHCLLNENTRHLINAAAVQKMKAGVMLINTARGGVVDTEAVIDGLNSGKIGGLGLDVYEFEKGIFFRDHSHDQISDKLFGQLREMENVIITGHQAFFTEEALRNITNTSLENIFKFSQGEIQNKVSL